MPIFEKNPQEFVLLVLDNEILLDPILKLIRDIHPGKSIKILTDKPERTYSPKQTDAEAAVQLTDNLFPDLIIMGHNGGAGWVRARLMPKGYIPLTIVIRFGRLLRHEKRPYKNLGFKYFCNRDRIADYIQRINLICTLQRLRRKKLAGRLRLEIGTNGSKKVTRKRKVPQAVIEG